MAPLSRPAIVAAARAFIRAEGLEALSLRRVAADLGVTAPALYAHVASKKDLLRAVAEEELDALSRRFAAVAADDPLDRTRGYCRAYIDHALEEPALFRTLFLFPPQLVPDDAPTEQLPAATRAFALPAAAIGEATERGLLRDGDPLLTTLATWTAMHGAAEVLLMDFGFDEDFREALIEAAVDTMLLGITRR